MSSHYINTVLNALQEAIFILDSDRKIIFANPAAEDLFGKGFVGSDFVQVIRHPECIKMIGQVIQGQANAGRVVTIEYPIKATFQMLATDLGTDNDNGEKVLLSLADISDLREAEQMRSDFVANVSHELRSPLTALSGFIETLKGSAKNDPDARERFLGLMEHEASRMVRLISDLLSLSKVEAKLRVRPQGNASIADVLTRVTTTLADQAEKAGKSIIFEAPDDLSVIPGSEDELTQVFQNLIENAIKYGRPDSKVTITISQQKNVAGIPGPALAIEVKDEGDGIPQKHISRLTERFYRVDSHRSREQGGTGLGLAIVKHIINRHRGRLQITSIEGIGSIFTVYLPQIV